VTTYVQLHIRANEQRRERGGIGGPWSGHPECADPRNACRKRRPKKQQNPNGLLSIASISPAAGLADQWQPEIRRQIHQHQSKQQCDASRHWATARPRPARSTLDCWQSRTCRCGSGTGTSRPRARPGRRLMSRNRDRTGTWQISARSASQWTSAEPARLRPPASQPAIRVRARSITEFRSSSAISHQ
jgi:hypothetical protein